MRATVRAATTGLAAAAAVLLAGGPAYACGGLIGPNGAVNLLRTTTFAGYHEGVEHYVTSFSFAGGGGKFGSLTPLPGVPTSVERGGDWTLQRLIRETTPVSFTAGRNSDVAAGAAPQSAQVLLETKVDALDITVLKGGGAAVGKWATDHGFRLPPDAPEVLDFYARRSPIFLAAAFDADRARKQGLNVGDGTPVHVTIPTPNPWVPLRILALGKQRSEIVEAEVYLLTDRRPELLSTVPVGGRRGALRIAYDESASPELLRDLNADRGMDWVPTDRAWLTKVVVRGTAEQITGDLAIDASGQRTPSRLAAGFLPPPRSGVPADESPARGAALVAVAVLSGLLVARALGRRTAR